MIFRWHYYPYKNRKQKLKDCIVFFKKRCYNWEIANKTINEILKNETPENLQDFLYCLNWEEAFLKDRKFKIYGDKTPFNTYYLPLIHRKFPIAKFVFLLRDPRNVIVSHLKMNPKYKLETLVNNWLHCLKHYERLSKNNPNFILVKYEELVHNPQKSIDKILAHLALEAQDNLLENYEKNMFYFGRNRFKKSSEYKEAN